MTYNGTDILRQLPGCRNVTGWATVAGGTLPRDADSLMTSNHRVALRRMLAAAGMTPDQCGDVGTDWEDYPHPVGIAHFRHFAFGWIDEIVYRTDVSALVECAADIADALEDYPILDEMDYSEQEWSDNHPDADDLCYSDDPDCGCGRERA